MSPRARRRRIRRCLLRVMVSISLILAGGPTPAVDAGVVAAPPTKTTWVHQAEIHARIHAACVRIHAAKRTDNPRLRSSGAGVILSSDGVIATAHHVVRGFEKIQVILSTGEHLDARVIASENSSDLAFLQVRASRSLEAAPLAPNFTAQAGTKALVVGNPRDMGQASVAAVVGGFQNVRWDGNLARLQSMQGSITQGNSGGGTFDQRTGELLGVTVAKSSARPNTGYMIPISSLLAILERKRLPIHELEDSQEIYSEFGVRLRAVRLIDGPHRRGMLITAVRPCSAAAAAGWEVGDVLVGLDKYQMIDLSAVLFVAQSSKRAGGEINFILARGDQTTHGTISLRRQNPVTDPIQQAAADSPDVAVNAEPVLSASP